MSKLSMGGSRLVVIIFSILSFWHVKVNKVNKVNKINGLIKGVYHDNLGDRTAIT